MVSPVDKAGFSVTASDGTSYKEGQHARGLTVLQGGGGFAYSGGGAVGDPQSQAGLGIPYRGLRGTDGWTSTPLNGPIGPPAPIVLAMGNNQAISTDGSRTLLASPAALVEGGWPCTATNISCAWSNLYLQDNDTLERRLIVGWAEDHVAPTDAASLADATDDLRTIIFTSPDRFTPNAIQGVSNLYEWKDDDTPRGQLRLVGLDTQNAVLPDGAAAGQGPTTSTQVTARSLSRDGRRIFFTSGGQLYLRQDGSSTVRVSRSQRATPDPDGPQEAKYWTAEAAHGSAVFFTSGEKLTDGSTAEVGQPSLYRYDVESGRLTDLTAGAGAAGVLGVIDAGEDGRSVYFGATAQLVPGKGTAGDGNLYRWHDDGTADGAITFIATIGTTDEAQGYGLPNWAVEGATLPVQPVSPNGRFLGFLSQRPLAGANTAGTVQVYRYDALEDEVVCASCAADGSVSTDVAEFRQNGRYDDYQLVADDGLLAFQTTQSLVSADTNGVRDVYRYRDDGPQLISTGTDPDLSTYLGMTTNGDSIFFATRQRLLAQDVDGLADVYVARVDGGFRPAPAPAPCQDDACQGRPSIGPGLIDPGTLAFAGPGNVPALKAPRAKKLRRVTARLSVSVDRRQRITVRIKAPAAGRIRITGSRTARVTRKVSKAGTRSYRVKLTRKATRSLQRHGRLKITTKVAFTPKSGKGSSKTVARTIKEIA